jgi:hypothetical protein
MVQVGMNERTKKHLQTRKCSRKNPVFYQNKSDFQPIDKPGTTQKSGTATTELVNLK